MKRLFHFACLILILSSVSVLHGNEPRETLRKYLLFFNTGYRGRLEDFRACFVPEERERIVMLPGQQSGVSNDNLDILEELKSSSRCEFRYRIGPDDSVYTLVLENRNGKWLVNSALTEEMGQRKKKRAAAGRIPHRLRPELLLRIRRSPLWSGRSNRTFRPTGSADPRRNGKSISTRR